MITTSRGTCSPGLWRAISIVLLLISGAGTSADQQEPVRLIDRRIEEGWERMHLVPANPADDASYHRRVSLDLVGRIPTVAETRAFLADEAPDKRAKLVDRLLDSPEFDQHLGTLLRRTWVPQTDTQEFSRLIPEYEAWLIRRLRARTPLDELVRQQLTTPVSRAALPINPEGDLLGSPAFLAVSGLQPENLAANTARAFLGINIDCAQCHDHPFARWSRDQFWQTAAFFVRPQSSNGDPTVPLSIAVGDTGKQVTPVLLTDEKMEWPAHPAVDTGRQLLADWITSPKNPWFARNAVNRLWAVYFGTGFVEPLDDLSGEIPPSHPELFAELAEAFARSGFDLRGLVRAMVLSRPYQLSGVPPSGAAEEALLFSRMPIRALTGEQLYDSLQTAAGLPYPASADRNRDSRNVRAQFAAEFLVSRPAEGQRSLVQALTLMNGSLTADVTGPGSPLLVALEAPFLSDQDRLETLFLATLSRLPTAAESEPLLKHLQSRGNRRAALSDIFWALCNSSEFNTNH